MSSPEPDSKIVSEDEEERIYQLIYGMDSTDGNQEKEKILITPSPELSPVHLEMSAERKGSEGETAYSTKPEQTEEDEQGDIPLGPEIYPLNNIRDIPVVNAEEKPWRRPGADISDYFNYGFDEESWNTYCSKQSKLRTASRKLYTQVMAEKWKTKHEETDSYSAYPSSDSKSTHAFRPSNAASDVCGEQPGPSRTVEGRSRLNAKGKKPKVVTQMSPEEDRITSYEGLTLPSPFKVDDLFAYTSPPSFLFRCGPPPPPPPATLKGRDSEGSDQLSTSTSSGVPFLNQRSNPIGAIKTAKAWECFIRQEKSDSHKGRTRHYDHDKESQRDRDKDGESSSFTYNRGEARMRQRDNAERGHKSKTFERLSGEMEEWQKERRHREYKSACSSSSSSRNRSEGDEDRDSQSRHKRKKAKRNRKDKETCKVSSDE